MDEKPQLIFDDIKDVQIRFLEFLTSYLSIRLENLGIDQMQLHEEIIKEMDKITQRLLKTRKGN